MQFAVARNAQDAFLEHLNLELGLVVLALARDSGRAIVNRNA